MAQFIISKKKLRSNIPWLAVISFAIFGVLSSNPLLTIAAFALLLFFVKLFWRPGEPPVLFYMMGFQWLQATVLIFSADVQGLPLQGLDNSRHVVEATWLSMAAMLTVALGLRLGAGPTYAAISQPVVSSHASQLSVRRLFFASLLAMGFASVMGIAAYMVRGLSQPILIASWLHWIVVYIFAYTVLSQRRGYLELAIIFIAEILIGFLGFFSEFKVILMIFLLAALAAPSALRGVRLRVALGVSACILVLGVVWTGIKQDYRDFLNQGTTQQVVLVPIDERIDKLAELVGNLDGERLSVSFQILVKRITYVHFFSEAMHIVPERIPYEHGKLWWEAIQNFLLPRIINPDKPVLDDSVRTAYYTGKYVADADDGTSISLGYVAESYIDFGPVGMAFPLFVWGLFIGFIYRKLVRSTSYPLFGYGAATVLISIGASVLETSNVKMLGSMVLGLVLFYFIQKLFAKRIMHLLVMDRKSGISAASEY
jgi:hypothetical protein